MVAPLSVEGLLAKLISAKKIGGRGGGAVFDSVPYLFMWSLNVQFRVV